MDSIVGQPRQEGVDQYLAVAVMTTAGTYPNDEHLVRVPASEFVAEQLTKAAKALNLTETSSWVVTVSTEEGQRSIKPDHTFRQNGLSCIAELDWGPSEGGGG